MPIDRNQAIKELFNDNYNKWRIAWPPKSIANTDDDCSQISEATAVRLRDQWVPNADTWKQTRVTGYISEGITRWVNSVEKGDSTIVKFHAWWNGGCQQYSFVRHFQIINE